MAKMRVALFSNNEGRVAEITDTLAGMQKVVGGYIQAVYLPDNLILVCNEEGSFDGSAYQEDYRMFGDFFICGNDGEDFTGLTQYEAEKAVRQIQTLLERVLRY